MNDVKFPITGSIEPKTIENGRTSNTAVSHIINPETNTLIESIVQSGTTSFTVEDAHTSKDQYLITSATYGKVGEANIYSGLSPTSEIRHDRFQWIPDNSLGTISGVPVSGTDFEDVSYGELEVEGVYGTGSTSISGITFDSMLQGDYYFGAKANSARGFWLAPTSSGAEGITCGRAIYVAKLPHNTNGNQYGTVGFSFLRQGSSTDSSSYKVYTRVNSNTTMWELVCTRGDTCNSTGDNMNNVGTELLRRSIEYNSAENRVADNKQWFMVEWEVQPSGTLIQVSHQPYSDGDTFETISSGWRPDFQLIDTRQHYTTTTLVPAWILCSNSNDSAGHVGIDMIRLEELESLPSQGINHYDLVGHNIADSARPLVINDYLTDRPGMPEGWLSHTSDNPLIFSNESLVDIAGVGMNGFRCYRFGGSNGHETTAMFQPKESEASGITHGVIRYCGATGTETYGGMPKLGIAFLRQDSAHDDNAYVVELYPNNSADWRVRLRKGQIYDTTFGNSADFAGSTLATSSTLTGHTSNSQRSWIEIRWQVVGSTRTIIEVKQVIQRQDYIEQDISPGNIDYSLNQVISYNDISSPYIATSLPPLIILRGSNNSCLMQQFELRRSK